MFCPPICQVQTAICRTHFKTQRYLKIEIKLYLIFGLKMCLTLNRSGRSFDVITYITLKFFNIRIILYHCDDINKDNFFEISDQQLPERQN